MSFCHVYFWISFVHFVLLSNKMAGLCAMWISSNRMTLIVADVLFLSKVACRLPCGFHLYDKMACPCAMWISSNCVTLIVANEVLLIIVVIITWPREKPWEKNHSFQGLWFVQMGYVYAKFRVWCHSFQQIKSQHLCLVVFCLLFSMTVSIQHQLCHSIVIAGNRINSKQSP